MRRRLALGLDSGTQSLSAAIVDIDLREKVYHFSLFILSNILIGTFVIIAL